MYTLQLHKIVQLIKALTVKIIAGIGRSWVPRKSNRGLGNVAHVSAVIWENRNPKKRQKKIEKEKFYKIDVNKSV